MGVHLLDPEDGELVRVLIRHDDSITSIAWQRTSPLGALGNASREETQRAGTLATASSNGTVCIWDPHSADCLHVLVQERPAIDLVWLGSDYRLVTGGTEGSLHIWHSYGGEELLSLPWRGHFVA